MHLLFVLFDFTIVFCFAWDDYVASFCNSPFLFAICSAKYLNFVSNFRQFCVLCTESFSFTIELWKGWERSGQTRRRAVCFPPGTGMMPDF